MRKKPVIILGTRGIPARHGGFETFAEHLALYLVERGWAVTVYCQADDGDGVTQSEWRGIRLVHIPVTQQGALGTIVFDWKSVRHAARAEGLILTLGYNTAIFSLLHRLHGQKNIMNMDGIEWRRDKWSWPEKAWLYLNEWAGARLANHLIADHPAIQSHLQRHTQPGKISMIPYGADRVKGADPEMLTAFGLEPDGYYIVIARPEPENSIFDIVSAYSARRRNKKLVVLGDYSDANPFHRRVKQVANQDVVFLGAIYDQALLKALRFFAFCYVHGHRVGGTNPSLVEAMGAGNMIIAHDNVFNRWVIGDGGLYFYDIDSCCKLLNDLDRGEPQDIPARKAAIAARFTAEFTWDRVLGQYEQLLSVVLS